MLVGTALYIRLLVCAGLSLFIISRLYVYMVVCIVYVYNLTPAQLPPLQSRYETRGFPPSQPWSPPTSDIWWPSLEICSNLFIGPQCTVLPLSWHLGANEVTGTVGVSGRCASYWNDILLMIQLKNWNDKIISNVFRYAAFLPLM